MRIIRISVTLYSLGVIQARSGRFTHMENPMTGPPPVNLCAPGWSLAAFLLVMLLLPVSGSAQATSEAKLAELEALLTQQQALIRKQQAQLEYLAEQLDALKAEQQQAINEEQQIQIEALADELESVRDAKPETRFTWGGYGVVNYRQFDFYENSQDTVSERRASTDLERFILSPQFDLGNGWHVIAEIEFEHGGTGSTLEFEPEEAGEFEAEIEKGGEIVLEQAYLLYEGSPAMNWRFGEILVPVGMVNSHHEPTQYFTLNRSLAETSLLPSVWHETGIALFGAIGKFRYETQIVTGLDSSGFSGFSFVRDGMQGSFEFDNADDLGFVGRIDYDILPSTTLGASFYISDTAENRPRKNLVGDATVSIFTVHGRHETDALIVRGQYLDGTIEDSEAITQANLQFFQGDLLGISNTPVGHKAESWFIEGGYNLFSLFGGRSDKLFAFARYEAFDTHAEVEGDILKVDRYDREATTFGLNYFPQPGIVFKAEFSTLENQGATANEQDFFGLGLGIEF